MATTETDPQCATRPGPTCVGALMTPTVVPCPERRRGCDLIRRHGRFSSQPYI